MPLMLGIRHLFKALGRIIYSRRYTKINKYLIISLMLSFVFSMCIIARCIHRYSILQAASSRAEFIKRVEVSPTRCVVINANDINGEFDIGFAKIIKTDQYSNLDIKSRNSGAVSIDFKVNGFQIDFLPPIGLDKLFDDNKQLAGDDRFSQGYVSYIKLVEESKFLSFSEVILLSRNEFNKKFSLLMEKALSSNGQEGVIFVSGKRINAIIRIGDSEGNINRSQIIIGDISGNVAVCGYVKSASATFHDVVNEIVSFLQLFNFK